MPDETRDVVFSKVMENEQILSPHSWYLGSLSADIIMKDLQYIAEFIALSTLPRAYNHERYNKPQLHVAPESVASHTLLVALIVDRALDFIYKPDFKTTRDGYTREEVREAVLRHDLPENAIGDIPDDGTRNDIELGKNERDFWARFSAHSNRDKGFEKKVYRLLKEMQSKSSRTGCLIYVADKAAAILRTLYEDDIGEPARMSIDYQDASQRDRQAMTICDDKTDNKCRASEMWTISYFKTARTINCDKTGYITALIVMMTLYVNNKWYSWRAEDYLI